MDVLYSKLSDRELHKFELSSFLGETFLWNISFRILQKQYDFVFQINYE